MKPRLSEAPNGIVGNKGQHNRELLAVASAAPSSKSSSTATTIAVGKGSPRNRSNTDIVKRPVPRFTVVGSTESSPGTKKRPEMNTSGEGLMDGYSPAGKGKSPQPPLSPKSLLAPDTSPGRRRAMSDSQESVQKLEPTKPRTKLEEPAQPQRKGMFATFGRRNANTGKRAAQTIFDDPPKVGEKKAGDSGTFSRKGQGRKGVQTSAEDSVDGEKQLKKRGSSLFSREKEKKSSLNSSEREIPSLPSAEFATTVPKPETEKTESGKLSKGGSKRSGFFSKLFRQAKTGDEKPLSAKEQAAMKRKKGALAAQELEAREAQLIAAGFSQLPGTLLSRAKGESVDSKFVLQWDDVELMREIGEGAYALVYLAKVRSREEGAQDKDVALKELKLLGNEEDPDMHLEVAAVADAIRDCGFDSVAESVRLGASLIRDPKTYYSAKQFMSDALIDFKSYSDPDDEACNFIVSVMEHIVALPYPSSTGRSKNKAGKGAPQRLLEDVMREVEVLSKLWHKNIVEFVGCCVELPHLAIAMQYCHKGPLSDLLISDEVCIGWDLRMKWAKETSEAINYLHGIDPKIIHRDLKADNILIDKNNTAYVTDFGLSKAKVLTMMNPAGPVSMAGRARQGGSNIGISNSRAKYRSFVEFSEIAGTPSYLAPELWRNESYTETVDVYSFGIVLWEILARDVPYRSLDNEELVYALRDRHMRPPVPKWTPESYKLLMERCWAEQPSARPSMEQIMKLLALLLDKHVYQWPPPENYSLDEEVQRQHVIEWRKGKQDKEAAMSLAEKKLLAAKEQLKNLKHTGGDAQVSPRGVVSPRGELPIK